MRPNIVVGVLAAILLVSLAATPAVAATPGEQVDECENAANGPGEQGPPGFVGGLVPDFVADLIGALPVPNFVKSLFGAATC